MKRLLLAAIPLLLVACASTTDNKSADPGETKVYRTGSNLPVRDPEPSTTTRTVNPSAIKTQPVPSLNPRPGG